MSVVTLSCNCPLSVFYLCDLLPPHPTPQHRTYRYLTASAKHAAQVEALEANHEAELSALEEELSERSATAMLEASREARYLLAAHALRGSERV